MRYQLALADSCKFGEEMKAANRQKRESRMFSRYYARLSGRKGLQDWPPCFPPSSLEAG
jgi:hypothetical protein